METNKVSSSHEDDLQAHKLKDVPPQKRQKKDHEKSNEETNSKRLEMNNEEGGDHSIDDWESVMENMITGTNLISQTMLHLGKDEEVSFLVHQHLFNTSVGIRKDYGNLVLKILNKECASNDEEHEALRKISELKVAHVSLIRDVLTHLTKDHDKAK